MSDQKDLWDKRERYQFTPDRYSELSSMHSIKNLFASLGKQWKEKRTIIRYADIGCSNGKGAKSFANFLEKSAGIPVKTMGIDASEQCKVQCEEKGLDYIRLDLGSEPIPVSDFQVLTCFETIEHIFNTDLLIESMRRALSPDGVLLITTLNVVCLKNRILVPLGIQPINTEVSTKKLSYGYRINSLKKMVDAWEPAGHIRPFTLYSLREILEDNNFTIVGSYGLENWRSLKFLEVLAKNMCTGMLVIAKPS